MWCGAAFPHLPLAVVVARDSAGDEFPRCAAPAPIRSIFANVQKADFGFSLPFRVQCASPPLSIPTPKIVRYQILEGGDLK
jgi:hypothetical protein